MSNFNEHINRRIQRYNKFIQLSSPNELLKGLHHIELHISETCTRKCFFCPRSNEKIYPNKKLFMSLSTIENFAKSCTTNNYKGDISFTGFGEPLSHPFALDIFEVLKKHKLSNYINLTTNGDFLSKITPQKIYDFGITHITISCYDGEEEYNKFKILMAPFEGNYFIRKLWKQNKDFAKVNYFADRTNNSLVAINSPCYIPFYKMFIDYNGDVLLCSADWFRKHKGFGNINYMDLNKIWHSTEFKKVRKDLINGNRIGPKCSTCTVQGTLLGKESADLLNE